MSTWFSGKAEHTLDAKGRVILPARYRERLNGGLYLSPGQDRCIDVYPLPEFERAVERLRKLPRENRKARAYIRIFLSGSEQEIPDSQGRITIPQHLRDWAGLGKDLTIVGNMDKVEIWDRESWEAYQGEHEPDFADIDTPFDFDIEGF